MADAPRPGGLYLVNGKTVDAHGRPLESAASEAAELEQDTGNDDAATLADDYPGVAELRAAGVATHDAVRAASDEQLRAIDGIGPKTLKQIREIDPAAEAE